MDKGNMILIPLFIMFMVGLVQLGDFGAAGDSADFYNTRTVTDGQIFMFDNFVDNAYVEYGDPYWNTWEIGEFLNEFTELLDDNFGEAAGHWNISTMMRDEIADVWENSASHLDNAQVEYIISLDPSSVEEAIELQAASATIDPGTLVFVGLFAGIVAAAVIVGITILGSGLSDVSITFVLKITMFIIIWSILSGLTYADFDAIPVAGGWSWIVLTFIYAIGVFFNLSGAEE